MELFLNLSWLAVASVILCLWLWNERESGADFTRQLIAVAVLVAILFPVISVSDDLLAVQNPSETDSFLRRDHLVPSSDHPVQSTIPYIVPMNLAGLGFVFQGFVAASQFPVIFPKHPELSSVGNRPPPAV